MKPHSVVPQEPGIYDDCYSPPYILHPILPYIPKDTVIWEPCAGDDYLGDALRLAGYTVISTDLRHGREFDLFTMATPPGVGLILTNPPYSIKARVIAELLRRRLPWALFVPFETTASKKVRDLFAPGTMEQMYLDGRPSFRMPHMGWAGGGSMFDTIWLSCGVTGQAISEGALPHRLDFHRRVRSVLNVLEVKNDTGKVVDRIVRGREPTREELLAWSGFGAAVAAGPAQLTLDLPAPSGLHACNPELSIDTKLNT